MNYWLLWHSFWSRFLFWRFDLRVILLIFFILDHHCLLILILRCFVDLGNLSRILIALKSLKSLKSWSSQDETILVSRNDFTLGKIYGLNSVNWFFVLGFHRIYSRNSFAFFLVLFLNNSGDIFNLLNMTCLESRRQFLVKVFALQCALDDLQFWRFIALKVCKWLRDSLLSRGPGSENTKAFSLLLTFS